MKSNFTASQIVFVVGLVLLVGALAYFSGQSGNNNGAQLSAAANSGSAVDHHGNSAAQQVYANLDVLVDKPAPAFSLTDGSGNVYSSESLRGKNIILFFNEGLMCYPACWSQIAAFPKDARLNSADTVILSVVVDSSEDWRSAVKKMPELAAATVVFDSDKSVSRKFGMLNTASSMHYGSLPGHAYVVIDAEGVVRHVFDDPNMALHNNQLAEVVSGLN